MQSIAWQDSDLKRSIIVSTVECDVKLCCLTCSVLDTKARPGERRVSLMLLRQFNTSGASGDSHFVPGWKKILVIYKSGDRRRTVMLMDRWPSCTLLHSASFCTVHCNQLEVIIVQLYVYRLIYSLHNILESLDTLVLYKSYYYFTPGRYQSSN